MTTRLTKEEAETLVTCEGCGVHLPMKAAVTTEDPVYLCAQCLAPMVPEPPAFTIITQDIPNNATPRQREMIAKYDAEAVQGNKAAAVIALALRKKIARQPLTPTADDGPSAGGGA